MSERRAASSEREDKRSYLADDMVFAGLFETYPNADAYIGLSRRCSARDQIAGTCRR
jgi:hypothetical protein